MYRLATTFPGELRESQAIGNALTKLKAAESNEDREAASSELREALADQFDNDIERRKKELEAVAAKLKEMQDLLDKRIASADKIIDLRMQVLLQDADGLGWNNASSADIFRYSLPSAVYQPAERVLPNSRNLKPAGPGPNSGYKIVTEEVTDENNNRFRPVQVQTYEIPGATVEELHTTRPANGQGGR